MTGRRNGRPATCFCGDCPKCRSRARRMKHYRTPPELRPHAIARARRAAILEARRRTAEEQKRRRRARPGPGSKRRPSRAMAPAVSDAELERRLIEKFQAKGWDK